MFFYEDLSIVQEVILNVLESTTKLSDRVYYQRQVWSSALQELLNWEVAFEELAYLNKIICFS